MLPCGGPVGGKGRDLLGNEETTVGGESFKYDLFEGELQDVRGSQLERERMRQGQGGGRTHIVGTPTGAEVALRGRMGRHWMINRMGPEIYF